MVTGSKLKIEAEIVVADVKNSYFNGEIYLVWVLVYNYENHHEDPVVDLDRVEVDKRDHREVKVTI